MKKFSLNITDVQLLPNGEAVIVTKLTPNNISKNGVYKLSAGNFRRIVERTLGVFNPIGFKHIIASANGAAKYAFEAIECKAGEPWEKVATGEKGIYTKDWIKYTNQSVELGVFATMKLAEMSLQASFAQAATDYAYTSTPKVAVTANVEANDIQPDGSDESSSDAPTI